MFRIVTTTAIARDGAAWTRLHAVIPDKETCGTPVHDVCQPEAELHSYFPILAGGSPRACGHLCARGATCIGDVLR